MAGSTAGATGTAAADPDGRICGDERRDAQRPKEDRAKEDEDGRAAEEAHSAEEDHREHGAQEDRKEDGEEDDREEKDREQEGAAPAALVALAPAHAGLAPVIGFLAAPAELAGGLLFALSLTHHDSRRKDGAAAPASAAR